MKLRSLLLFAALLPAVACGNTPAPPGDPAAPSVALQTAAAAPALASPRAQEPPDPAGAPAPVVPFASGEAAFRTVRETLLKSYGGAAVTDDALYRAAVQGMLEHIDARRASWNKLLTPEELAALHSDLQGEVVGVGAEIHFDPSTGYSDVLGVFSGSPAEKAKVIVGDKIVDVNGKLFSGKTQRDVLAEIRGKAGETVTLTVLRADKLVVLPIVREVVAYEPTRAFMLADAVGYLQIRSFNAKTRAGIDHGLSDLAARRARALVVDMRGNPGGSFDEAIACADALLPAGATVVRLAEHDRKDQTFVSKGATVLGDAPMVVLVDGDTSSGGEFVTAALQESRHATVVGKKTFGKWSLQRIDDLPNGYAVKYTVGVLSTAAGKTYDGVGLEPDVEVDSDKATMTAAFRETDPVKRVSIDGPLRAAAALLRR